MIVSICFSIMGLCGVMPVIAEAIHQTAGWRYFSPTGLPYYYPKDVSYWLNSGYLSGLGYRFFAINKYILDAFYSVPALRNSLKLLAAFNVVLCTINYLWEGIEADNEKRN